MKTLTTGAVCLGIGIGVGLIISANLHETTSLPPLTPESKAKPIRRAASTEPDTTATPNAQTAPVALEKTNEATLPPVVSTVRPEPESPKAAALRRSIEALVSAQADLQEKRAVLKQLRESGQLDDALTTLRQGAAENPTSPAYRTAIGEVDLQKAYALSLNGGSINQMGMAGMDADQNFDESLKLDPANWEAQFWKASAMSHWPAELNKGQEVIQRFSNLIDQQESLPPQPQFAQTYALLGDQYQKAGQPDHALQTWQLGAQKFPADPTLRARIAGSQNQ